MYPAFSKTNFCILITNKCFQDDILLSEEERMNLYVLSPALNSHLLDNTKSCRDQTEATNSYFMMTILLMLKSLLTTNMNL